MVEGQHAHAHAVERRRRLPRDGRRLVQAERLPLPRRSPITTPSRARSAGGECRRAGPAARRTTSTARGSGRSWRSAASRRHALGATATAAPSTRRSSTSLGGSCSSPARRSRSTLDRRGAHMNALNVGDVDPGAAGARRSSRCCAAISKRSARRSSAPVGRSTPCSTTRTSCGARRRRTCSRCRRCASSRCTTVIRSSTSSATRCTRRPSASGTSCSRSRFAADGGPLYGVATDDSHDYHRFGTDQRNSGRGWIMVRAARLDGRIAHGGDAAWRVLREHRSGARRRARETVRGYRSRSAPAPGVVLHDAVHRHASRVGHDERAVSDSTGRAVTRRYSRDVGAVLAEVAGTSPSYVLRGDELYVRARIVSSRPKANGSFAGEVGDGVDAADPAVTPSRPQPVTVCTVRRERPIPIAALAPRSALPRPAVSSGRPVACPTRGRRRTPTGIPGR